MSVSQGSPRPAILSISSHVARGSVGNRSVVFALETLGHTVWSVPTVILPFHPGHGRGTRIETDPEMLASLLEDLRGAPWKEEVAAIMTGYLANSTQVAAVATFVEAMKASRPGLPYLFDPVIGDVGGLYVPGDQARAMRDRLLPLADIVTPNRHELAWLCEAAELLEADAVVNAARTLGPPLAVVTSAPATMRDHIGNLLVTANMAILAEHRVVAGPANGAGDLFSALFLAGLLEPLPAERALEKASASIFELVVRAARHGDAELMPERDPAAITQPAMAVRMRRLTTVPGT